MRPRIFVPGWGGSGPGHWQTLWQARLRGARRVEMPDWFDPVPRDWSAAIDRAVVQSSRDAGQAPVLIAHSLGCIAIARWAAESLRPIAAALLVAPPDVERAGAPEALRAFAPVPRQRLPFRSMVVASTNDEYSAEAYSVTLAAQWGSELVLVPGAGHLNVASGHGEWPQGQALLRQLSQD